MTKKDKMNKKQKIKSVLRLVLNYFCYTVTALSILLAVIMCVFSCSQSKIQESDIKRSRQLLNGYDTQLKSSLGFNFYPLEKTKLSMFANMTDAPSDTIQGDLRFPNNSNDETGIAYFDIFVLRYSLNYSNVGRIFHGTSTNYEGEYPIGVIYNGEYYLSYGSTNFTSQTIGINDGNGNTNYLYFTDDVIIVCPTSVGLSGFGNNYIWYSDLTLYGTHTNYNGTIYSKFIYYSSFDLTDFENKYGYSPDLESENIYASIRDDAQTILNSKYENYYYDLNKYILNPYYIPTENTKFYLPVVCENYFDDSYDEVLESRFATNSLSYGQSFGGQTYIQCFGVNYYYDFIGDDYYSDGGGFSDLLPTAERHTNSQNVSFYVTDYYGNTDTVSDRWILRFNYYVYTFRGYFPKGVNSIDYKDIFMQIDDNGAINRSMSFRFSAYSLDIAYTQITTSTNSIDMNFRSSTDIFVDFSTRYDDVYTVYNQTWRGIRCNANYFTFYSSGENNYEEGYTVAKNKSEYTDYVTGRAYSVNVNDLMYYLRAMYDYELTPIQQNTSGIMDAIYGVFSLIGNCLTGFTPFLNLSFGAGITLGVLFFTPLVVYVIFAIIKLFKR